MVTLGLNALFWFPFLKEKCTLETGILVQLYRKFILAIQKNSCGLFARKQYVLLIISSANKNINNIVQKKYMVSLDFLTKHDSITLESSIYFGMSETDLSCTEASDDCGMRIGIRFQLLGK